MTAPVALFAYKRPAHTKATLEALARNTLAGQTDLYVFSDGAKSDQDSAAVEQVRRLIGDLRGFASVRLIERQKNMGLAKSVISGVTELLEVSESVIVLEDDLVTSRHFLSYMNNALEHYRHDPIAFSVTGHTFPEKYLHIPEDYPYDTYAGYRCSSWSWGIWRDRWQQIDWEMKYFGEFSRDIASQYEFNRGGQDLTTLLTMQHDDKIDSWAIRFCYAHYVNRMHCMYPVKTLVRNIGLDNTGTHSKPEPRFFHSRLDESWEPTRLCPAKQVDARIEKSFRSVFDPPEPTGRELIARKTRSLAKIGVHHVRVFLSRIRRIFVRPIRIVDILVVNTFQKDGGAARAAYRTFRGIQRMHPGAQYLNLVKEDLRPEISGRYHWSFKGLLATRFASLDRIPMARYPNRLPVTFTPAIVANPLRVPLSRFNAKLIHLHWVASSMLRIEEIGRLNVPVVWTLHDTWAFTGGCHYPGECDGFMKECGRCPQLGSERENDLSRSIWHRKQQAFSRIDLVVVAPSRWLADVARRSSLLAGRRVEVIPNGLDTKIYKPIDKRMAKEYLEVDQENPVLLFGAQWLTDPRKGGDLLCAAIAHIDFPCTLLVFGEGQLDFQPDSHIKIRSVGTLKDDMSLAMMYSAADVFICPSREDNLPNTVAEALACGTPCAAFAVNGLPEMIEHQKTGWLAKAFDPKDLATGIIWLTRHPDPESLRQASRDKALTEYSMETMAKRYADLYADLLGGRP